MKPNSTQTNNKLPCIKCITLAICKAIALEADGTKVNDVLIAGNRLAFKCKLIEDYLLPIQDDRITMHLDMGRLQIALTYLVEGIEK
jgi:hypothetical protein